ncbi:unnamed protein product [Nezara viridula]|uniref:Uncharacterized protein n=1 Tax=Nezara viridula TaxID=85310 RepID=A0A9P0HCK3_NEZVI|nr:unnamed protein product [Nezara viridula]
MCSEWSGVLSDTSQWTDPVLPPKMTIPEAGRERGGWLGKMEGNCAPTPLPAFPHHSPLQTRQPCPSFISTRAASRHGPLRRAGPHSHLLTYKRASSIVCINRHNQKEKVSAIADTPILRNT